MSTVTVEQSGLQALSAEATTLLRTLDAVLESWGTDAGAASMIMPPLLPVESLARLDFYENFPHQALVVSPLDLAKREPGVRPAYFRPDALQPASLGLPSAACFAVYLYHEGQALPGNTTVTVLGRCFRREEGYQDLRRLIGFHMREIVAMGSREFVQQHLDRFGDRIAGFITALGLPFRKEAATDPFYDRGGQRALLQKLSPVKHEFIVDDLAIASLNVHRNFFGERCDISLAGEPIFTSCVAFGLERWLSVLRKRYGSWQAATEAVHNTRGEVAA
jgi:seryl-tRNA synthetase